MRCRQKSGVADLDLQKCVALKRVCWVASTPLARHREKWLGQKKKRKKKHPCREGKEKEERHA